MCHVFSLIFRTFHEFFIQRERTACKVKATLHSFKKQNVYILKREETSFLECLLHASHCITARLIFTETVENINPTLQMRKTKAQKR